MKRALALFAGALMLIGAAQQPSRPVPLAPEEAARQGKELAAEILAKRPDQNAISSGALKVRRADGKRFEIPVKFALLVTPTNWVSVYSTVTNAPGFAQTLAIEHTQAPSNTYYSQDESWPANDWPPSIDHLLASLKPALNGESKPFAQSDFWFGDLGIEFFHWPEQRLLKKEMRRGQSCYVLESTNPNPAPGSYARVLSWLDIDSVRDSGGPAIVFATAYDQDGRPLKDFAPKTLKKVQGEWQLEEMEMDNRQTGSRSWVEFDLSSQSK